VVSQILRYLAERVGLNEARQQFMNLKNISKIIALIIASIIGKILLQHIPSQKSFVDVTISLVFHVVVAFSVASVLPFCVTADVMHRRQDKNKQNDGIRRSHRRHY
jgi:hypothetical protein